MDKLLKGVDVVIHTAAFAHEGLSVFSPHLITQNIVTGSVALFSAAIENKVNKTAFFPSDCCVSIFLITDFKTMFALDIRIEIPVAVLFKELWVCPCV